MKKDEALSFLTGLLDREVGTLLNKSEDDAINILKLLIMRGVVETPFDEVGLQDIVAITLNMMIPRYQVSAKRSNGRNLITYYRQEQDQSKKSEDIKKIKKHLEDICLKAVATVNKNPHH